jgi:hypothetical protein
MTCWFGVLVVSEAVFSGVVCLGQHLKVADPVVGFIFIDVMNVHPSGDGSKMVLPNVTVEVSTFFAGLPEIAVNVWRVTVAIELNLIEHGLCSHSFTGPLKPHVNGLSGDEERLGYHFQTLPRLVEAEHYVCRCGVGFATHAYRLAQ